MRLSTKQWNDIVDGFSQPRREEIGDEANILSLHKIYYPYIFSSKIKTTFPCKLDASFNKANNFYIVLSNDAGEKLLIGYNKDHNRYFIDRTQSGKTDFQKDFAAQHVAPRLSNADAMHVSLIIDVSSVELFADDGLSVMTEVFFPTKPYNHISIESAENIVINKLQYSTLKSVW